MIWSCQLERQLRNFGRGIQSDYVVSILDVASELASAIGFVLVRRSFLCMVFEFSRLSVIKVRHSLYRLLILFAALALVGTTTGLAGGMSRTGVVGDLYPAAFTFISAAAVYLFGINETKGTIVAMCVMVFSSSMFLGYMQGAEIRNVNDEIREHRTACFKALSNPELLKDDVAFERFIKLTSTAEPTVSDPSPAVKRALLDALRARLGEDAPKSLEGMQITNQGLCEFQMTNWKIVR